jgi:hypothetical protein
MIGIAPQDIAIYPMLTAAENLRASLGAFMASAEQNSKAESVNCYISSGWKGAATITQARSPAG